MKLGFQHQEIHHSLLHIHGFSVPWRACLEVAFLAPIRAHCDQHAPLSFIPGYSQVSDKPSPSTLAHPCEGQPTTRPTGALQILIHIKDGRQQFPL